MTSTNDNSRIPLVLIHGFPHDRSLWEPQTKDLKDIARPIAPDLRGFGDSGSVSGTVTMAEYASDLKTLLNAMSIDRAVVCGLSMGGYVALAFTANYPEMVSGLVLCHTRAGEDDQRTRKGRQGLAKSVMENGVPAVSEGLLEKMLSERTHTEDPALVEKVRQMIERQQPSAVAAAARGMAVRSDRNWVLPRIAVPTLIITAADDRAIPMSESEAMHKAIPKSELVVIPDAGHLSNLENPEAFNKCLRRFLLNSCEQRVRNVA